jgi:hypothetical protein
MLRRSLFVILAITIATIANAIAGCGAHSKESSAPSASASGSVSVAPSPSARSLTDASPAHAFECSGRTPLLDDSDGDGVLDSVDACPCAPGADFPDDPPNVRGCPFDAPPRPHR